MTEKLPQSTEKSVLNLSPREQTKAINIILHGKTPESEVKIRKGRGGTELRYVDTYYMTHMANLVFSWRWSSEVLEESAYPDWANPKEVGARIRVTVWDKEGNKYFHDAWGQKDVARYETVLYKRINDKIVTPTGEPTTDLKKAAKVHDIGDIISIFDDRKAAISDGIKKCLSYFGIADDVYRGKEVELYLSDLPEQQQLDEESKSSSNLQFTTSESPQQHFISFIAKYKLSFSKVFNTLGVIGINDITDYLEAERRIVKAYSLPEQEEVEQDNNLPNGY